MLVFDINLFQIAIDGINQFTHFFFILDMRIDFLLHKLVQGLVKDNGHSIFMQRTYLFVVVVGLNGLGGDDQITPMIRRNVSRESLTYCAIKKVNLFALLIFNPQGRKKRWKTR